VKYSKTTEIKRSMNSQQYVQWDRLVYGMVQVDRKRYRFFYDVSGQYLIEQVAPGYEIWNRQGEIVASVRSLKLASQYVTSKIKPV